MSLAAWLLPVRCAGCGSPGASPCLVCARALRPAPALAPPPGLDSLAALIRYDDAARALITAVKYRGARAGLDGLAAPAASLVVGPGAPGLASVTWAPTTPDRRRDRGFDQAELLARSIGRRTGVPVVGALRRLPGAHQTGLTAHDRHLAPRFVALRVLAGAVLVVDDVCTTGATLTAAAVVLRAAGADQVHGLVLARTPASHERSNGTPTRGSHR